MWKYMVLKLLGVRGQQVRTATKNILWAAEWKSPGGCGSVGEICGVLPEHRLGFYYPWLGRPGEGVWWLKTQSTLRPWVHHWKRVQVSMYGVFKSWHTLVFTERNEIYMYVCTYVCVCLCVQTIHICIRMYISINIKIPLIAKCQYL